MKRLFLGYLFDVTWRALAALVIALVLVVPPVFAFGFDRDVALMFAEVIGVGAAFMYAARFAGNLSWLQIAPISRARLWWFNYVANLYPAVLAVLFALLLIGVGSFMPEPPKYEKIENAKVEKPSRESRSRIAPFGESAWPYLLFSLAMLHGVMIIPRGPAKRGSPPNWKSYAIWVGLVGLVFVPKLAPFQTISFVVWMTMIALFFTRASARMLGLPRNRQSQFYKRYGAATMLMTALGLASIW